MSIRFRPVAISALLAATLGGASFSAIAADTKPIVKDTCARTLVASNRTVAGHPGKSLRMPLRKSDETVQCAPEASKPLILASYEDARGGLALVRGQTDKALEQIYAKRSSRLKAQELTNLCVAYTVQRLWPHADDACNAALASAIDERAAAGRQFGHPQSLVDREVAVAYSNRAVMHWLSNDEIAAHNDLAKARKLAPTARYVSRNLQVAGSSSSLAGSSASLEPIG